MMFIHNLAEWNNVYFSEILYITSSLTILSIKLLISLLNSPSQTVFIYFIITFAFTLHVCPFCHQISKSFLLYLENIYSFLEILCFCWLKSK